MLSVPISVENGFDSCNLDLKMGTFSVQSHDSFALKKRKHSDFKEIMPDFKGFEDWQRLSVLKVLRRRSLWNNLNEESGLPY